MARIWRRDVWALKHQEEAADVPEKVGTVKLTQAVTVLPRQEYLLGGRLPSNVPMSPGNTVMVKSSTSRCALRGIMVSRVITPLWGDGWTPKDSTRSWISGTPDANS